MGFLINRYERDKDGGDFRRVTNGGPASRDRRQPPTTTAQCGRCHGTKRGPNMHILEWTCKECQGAGVVLVPASR